MTIVRRSAGLGIVILSVLGLLLCMAGTVGVCVGKSRMDAVAAALFGSADEAFEFMATRLDRVHRSLDKSRERISSLSRLAERLRTPESDLSTQFEPLAHTLDEVHAELKSAEQTLDALEAVAGGVNRVSEAMVVSGATASGGRKAGKSGESAGVTANRVAEFSAGVAEALAGLEFMRQELIGLRENKTLAREFAGAMITRVVELDAKLAKVSARINAFNAQVSTARASCADLGRKVHWWIAFATVTLMLVLLWFALSQIGVLRCGWRLARLLPRRSHA